MNEIFIQRLRLLMNEQKITQIRLSQDLFITQPTLSKVLNGKRSPSIDMIDRIATKFSTSSDYLIGRTDLRNSIYISSIILARMNEDQNLKKYYKEISETTRKINN